LIRKVGRAPHSRTKCAPWGTLDTKSWTGTPLPDEMRSLGTLDTKSWTGRGSGGADGEGAGRRHGQDPPLPSARSPRGGAPVRLHARRRGGRDLRVDPRPAIPLPRSAGIRGLLPGSPLPGIRAVSAARAGPRGQDAARGGDRVPARSAPRRDRGGGLPVALRGTVRRAFRELSNEASVVFGPSEDGGFYLLGLSSPDERLLQGFRWSTAEVLRNAAARCRIHSKPFSFLPPGRDVDTGEDLLALREWARTHGRPACPRTRAWITGFFGPGGGGFRGTTGRTPGPPRGSRSPRGG